MKRALFILLPLPLWLLAGGCERCSERAGPGAVAVDPAAGLPPPVEPRSDVAPLPWEGIPLGADPERFGAALGELTGIAAAELAARLDCAPRAALEMIEPGGDAMVERTPAGHALEGCALLRPGGGFAPPLLAVRGDFIDGRLASQAFDFPLEHEGSLLVELEGRFGESTRRSLALHTLLGVESTTAHIWNVGDQAWLLLPGRHTVTLMRQDPRAAAGLGRPAPPPPRGERISLDDIGLGGGLDLDAPVSPPDPELLRALLGGVDAGH